ncbi:MAG: phosphoribosylanthranilate isomerase [Cycloclasticus sp.]
MSLRTRVKICGITRAEDALAAVDAGADALGFVFYEASSRCVNTATAALICKKIPPFITKVALFVNAEKGFVEDVLNNVAIDVLQFHGDEDEAFCNSFNKPYIKAIRMQQTTDLKQLAKQYNSASGLLIDAYDGAQYGGTGQTFDWGLLPDECPLPLILAGGLNHLNVHEAIKNTQAYAVDVSSGVEVSKGVKDHQLIQQFMQEVKRAND